MQAVPQIIFLLIILANLLLAAKGHGKTQKEKPGNFWLSLWVHGTLLGILYWGGFFDVFTR